MRNQAISIEYILLILLGLFISYISLDWLYNSRSNILSSVDFYNRMQTEEFLSSVLYSLKYFYNASTTYKTRYYVYCNNNTLVIDLGNSCNPTFTQEQYSGDYIIVNDTIVKVFSNNSQGYYSGVIVGYKLARVCYESRDSYIILSDSCKVVPCKNCDIELAKLNGKLVVK